MPAVREQGVKVIAQPAANRAVIYTRVSSPRQVEGTSLESQQRDLLRLAEAMALEVADVFEEPGVSGASQERPALKAAIRAIENGEALELLVWDVTRLGRNIRHTLEVVDRIRIAGGRVRDLKGRTSDDQLTFTILAAIAEYELEQIRERTSAGREVRAAEGKWNGGPPPFGTGVVPADDQKGKILVEDALEANAIREVVRMIVEEGRTTGECCRWLNSQKIYTRQGNRWTSRNLLRVLRSKRLTGRFTQTAHQGRGKRDPACRAGTCGHSSFVVEHPEILSETQFQALQDALDRTAHGPLETGHSVYLLSQRLLCPCGGCFVGAGRANGARYYRCQRNTASAGDERCHFTGVRWIPAAKVEDEIWSAVCKVLTEPEHLLAAAGQYLQEQAASLPIQRKQLDRARRAVEALEAERRRVMREYTRGELDRDLLYETLQEIEEDLQSAQNHLAQLRAWLAEGEERTRQLARLSDFATRAEAWLREASPVRRKEVVELLALEVRVVARHQYEVTGAIPFHADGEREAVAIAETGPTSRKGSLRDIGMATHPSRRNGSERDIAMLTHPSGRT